jgi:methylmalonyl-CoA mutase N-terminal domain/subunit
VDRFAGRLSFFFNAHNRLLEEVAKFRAARRLWARILSEEFGAKEERSLLLRFHVQTAGSTLTLQQPENNVVRVTLQALAAVLGGCQSLHTNSRDEALALPSEEAAAIALRTQQIIAHESGAADLVDGLGGSWAVEALTDQIEAGVRDYLARIEERGGVLACVEDGWIQREIHETAYRTQQRIEAREETVVGVNAFREEEREGASIPVLRIDPSLERRQVERLERFRAARDGARAAEGCERVRETAEGDGNLLEAMVEAVDGGATLGEVADALRTVFGHHRSQAVL